MTFLRYRTEDMAVYGGSHGSAVKLSKIDGREQASVFRRDGTRVSSINLVPASFRGHYRAFRKIRKWQIVQEAPGEIILRIQKAEGFSETDEEEIRRKLQITAGVDVKITFVSDVELTRIGKFRFVLNRIESQSH